MSQRILAEDEKFLPEKFHVIFMGIVYLLRGENKSDVYPAFFARNFILVGADERRKDKKL